MKRRIFMAGLCGGVTILGYWPRRVSDGDMDAMLGKFGWRSLENEVPEHGQLCDIKTVHPKYTYEMYGKRCVRDACGYPIKPCGWQDGEKGLYIGSPEITWWRPA